MLIEQGISHPLRRTAWPPFTDQLNEGCHRDITDQLADVGEWFLESWMAITAAISLPTTEYSDIMQLNRILFPLTERASSMVMGSCRGSVKVDINSYSFLRLPRVSGNLHVRSLDLHGQSPIYPHIILNPRSALVQGSTQTDVTFCAHS